jgi:hypothetical protein
MIKIVSGWSDKGGSTNVFIELTNELNKRGIDTTFYGPHPWHLTKCKAALLDSNLKINQDDILICHFLQLPNRPNAKKVILSCHEKNLFEVGKIKQYWDKVVFLNDKHQEYHGEYTGDFSIIPNLKPNLVKKEKEELKKIAGIIGSFDENKQTHVSIKRALADNCEKVYLFGQPQGEYFERYVKPLCDNETVIIKGFLENKQEMYDMIGCVYHSSKSEVACLVKDECYLTNTEFYGNENTNHEVSTLTNGEIINKWIDLFNK